MASSKGCKGTEDTRVISRHWMLYLFLGRRGGRNQCYVKLLVYGERASITKTLRRQMAEMQHHQKKLNIFLPTKNNPNTLPACQRRRIDILYGEYDFTLARYFTNDSDPSAGLKIC